MGSKIRTYERPGLVVEYDAVRCIHAAECVHGLPEVFDPEARPWIQPERADLERIVEVVHRCPTGALRYRRTEGADQVAPPTENVVRVVPDGPLYVSGDLRIELEGGDDVLRETRVALCRCGASRNKPFCDNAHQEKGFQDPGAPAEHRLTTGDAPADAEGDGSLTITLAPDGPILIRGRVKVLAAEGAAATGVKAALCRCGASHTKPYCDGSHKNLGFTSG